MLTETYLTLNVETARLLAKKTLAEAFERGHGAKQRAAKMDFSDDVREMTACLVAFENLNWAGLVRDQETLNSVLILLHNALVAEFEAPAICRLASSFERSVVDGLDKRLKGAKEFAKRFYREQIEVSKLLRA